jgi:hypothetical protein
LTHAGSFTYKLQTSTIYNPSLVCIVTLFTGFALIDRYFRSLLAFSSTKHNVTKCEPVSSCAILLIPFVLLLLQTRCGGHAFGFKTRRRLKWKRRN